MHAILRRSMELRELAPGGRLGHESQGRMTPLAVVALIGLGLLAGLLIGAVGIGGVILVPSLVYFGGVPIHAAVAGAMMSYILTGLIGTLVYARARSIQW